MFKDSIFWLLLLFAAAYILGNIGSGSLTTWDEAVYANISRELLKSNNWLVLRSQGNPWFEKPPLYMWLTAIFYKVLGVSEFSTRITSSLFGIATVLLLYIFVRNKHSLEAGILASLILLAAPHFLHFAKMGMLDVSYTFFMIMMIYLFWRGQERPICLFFSGAVMFAGYLVKGPAIFLALFIILVYALFTKQLRMIAKPQFILGILFSGAMIFFWHYGQYLLAGPESLKKFFGYHVFERSTQALEGHTGGWNFYQKAVFNKNKPWSVLFYLSLLYTLWAALRKRDKSAILICVWVVSAYALYSLVKTKLHWYIIPIYPALAFSSALFLEKLLKKNMFIVFLSIILAGMLLQTQLSWSFKLDLNPSVKNVSSIAKKLYQGGSDIYQFGSDNGGLFYCDFARQFNEDTRRIQLSQNTPEAYLLAFQEYVQNLAEKYNFAYREAYSQQNFALYKIKFN